MVGLIGAVVGGGLTSGATLGVEIYRSRAARLVRQRAEAAEMHKSVRLVAEELLEAVFMLDIAIEEREWWPREERLPTEAWQEHRSTLALALNDDEWSWLSNSYSILARLNRQVDQYRSHGGQPPWEQETVFQLNVTRNETENSLYALREIAGLTPLIRKDDDRLEINPGQLRFRWDETGVR